MSTDPYVAGFEQLPAIDTISLALPAGQSVTVDCLRLDALHPFVSGNKWYKLKYHMRAAREAGKRELLSFGGAYSNHLHALAYAGRQCGFETRALVRGEATESLTPTLQDCKQWGMAIEWVSRQSYPDLAREEVVPALQEKYGESWIIPEGGAGRDGVNGVRDLFVQLAAAPDFDYQYLVCPVGSGTTLAGMIAARISGVRCLGFSALKGAHDLEQRVAHCLSPDEQACPWQIFHDYHFGGFAKMSARLRDFISMVHSQTQVVLDPVYTGKMLFGLLELLHQGRLPKDARILIVHTGGLQGWRGFGGEGPAAWNKE